MPVHQLDLPLEIGGLHIDDFRNAARAGIVLGKLIVVAGIGLREFKQREGDQRGIASGVGDGRFEALRDLIEDGRSLGLRLFAGLDGLGDRVLDRFGRLLRLECGCGLLDRVLCRFQMGRHRFGGLGGQIRNGRLLRCGLHVLVRQGVPGRGLSRLGRTGIDLHAEGRSTADRCRAGR